MLISIIIPCYNSEKTIPKCLKSLINQTYKNIEIICINDGSTDKTLKILNKFKKQDKRIKIVNNTNHGVSYTRNCGIDNAKGEYITFVDSDDYLEKNAIERITLNLNDIDILRYNFKVDNSHNHYNNSLGNYANKTIFINKEISNLYETFFTMNNIPTLCWLLFIKKDIIKKIRFDEKVSFMEDAKFYFEILQVAKNIHFFDEKLYHYVINNEGLSRNTNRLSKNIKDILLINEFFSKNLENDQIIKKINTNHINMISRYLVQIYINDKEKYYSLFKEIKNNINFKNIIMNSNIKKIEFKKRIYILSIKYHLNFITKIILQISYKKYK